MNDVHERLAQILVTHLGVDEGSITPASNFRADMAADSLDLLDLTLAVEDAFGIHIADDVAARLHTVGDLISFIRAPKQDRAAV